MKKRERKSREPPAREFWVSAEKVGARDKIAAALGPGFPGGQGAAGRGLSANGITTLAIEDGGEIADSVGRDVDDVMWMISRWRAAATMRTS